MVFYALIIPGLNSIPLTDHASNAHVSQKWNASNILTTMTGGGCGTVTVYVCKNDTTIYTCQSPTDPKKLLGLVTGSTDKAVITGFTSRISFWINKVKGCDQIGGGLAP